MTAFRDRTTWLQGDRFGCLQPPPGKGRAWRLVLLGPPGVGKGTQAAILAREFGACPLSTGDVFRTAHERSLAPGSPLAEAEQRMNRGELVPDDVVLGLIQNRRTCLRCPGGFILHGFPRTVAQSAALDGLLAGDRLKLDAVLSYELPLVKLIARLSGRRLCPRCHAVYHALTHPPAREGVCDHCGSGLIQRADDAAEAVHTRLIVHAEATSQVADYYQRQGLLVAIDASDTPEAIFERTLRLLASRKLQARGIELEPTAPGATN